MMIYRCCAAHAEEGAGGGGPRSGASLFPAVDLHCHALSLEVERLVAGFPEKLAEKEQSRRTLGIESATHNATQMLPRVFAPLTDIRRRLDDMAAMRVDVQVISPAPSQYYYWADEALAAQIVETQNNEIAELVRGNAGRIEGLGNIALQHPALAVKQLRRALELGLKGVEISSTVGLRELADPALDEFWRAAQETGAVVFLHPLGTSAYARLDRHYLTNAIGQPLETTIALSHLIFGGVFDRYPDVKLVAAHGGGYLPPYVGRLEHAYKVRPEARKSRHPPLAYLRRFYYDTVVHAPEVLRHLIRTVGISQVVLGTDYPYDMGETDPRALIEAVPELTASDRQAILGANAARLLGLELARPR